MVDLIKLITPVESMDSDEAKTFISEHKEGTYTLLDVRQPKEYEESHIPGAKLIPLPQLTDSLHELDKTKPTLVYCAIGGRSRLAAQLLAGQGFEKVHNLKGGIKAWHGLVAEGPEDLPPGLISGDDSPENIYRVSYGMESVMAEFYRTIAARTSDNEIADLMTKLALIEDKHKDYLLEIYRSMNPSGEGAAVLRQEAGQSLMEGGLEIKEVLDQYEEFAKTQENLLDLSMMLETRALDLYLRFANLSENTKTKELLQKIADEEKGHLASLGRLRESAAGSTR